MRLTALSPFAQDPLLAPASMTEDQRTNPVVEAILARRDERSLPGRRTDGRRIALVIEGGGMRGVVSAGMAAAIEQLGLTEAFDEVHGASAGAFNGAFLLAGQASYLAALYPHGFGNPEFVSFRRALRGAPVFDMDYVVDDVWQRQRPLNVDAILGGGIDLHCTATDVDTAEIVDLAGLGSELEIRCAMRASARLPWLAGPPVSFRGRRWLDATIAEAIPVHVAFAAATDALVLQTRPHGVSHTPLSGGVARLTNRYLQNLNPALVELVRTRSARYDELSAKLATQAADPTATPAVCVIRPPAGSLLISQTENRRNALAIAGSHGLRAAWMALTGEDPELVSIPTAHTRRGAPTQPAAGAPAAEDQQSVGQRVG
jgi:predicted patatin/cPLA2 family phospholipase